jgi:hypothetical protein
MSRQVAARKTRAGPRIGSYRSESALPWLNPSGCSSRSVGASHARRRPLPCGGAGLPSPLPVGPRTAGRPLRWATPTWPRAASGSGPTGPRPAPSAWRSSRAGRGYQLPQGSGFPAGPPACASWDVRVLASSFGAPRRVSGGVGREHLPAPHRLTSTAAKPSTHRHYNRTDPAVQGNPLRPAQVPPKVHGSVRRGGATCTGNPRRSFRSDGGCCRRGSGTRWQLAGKE